MYHISSDTKLIHVKSTNISFLKARESLECSVLNLALSPIHVVDGTKVHYVLNNELMVFIFASFIQLQKKIYFCMACL